MKAREDQFSFALVVDELKLLGPTLAKLFTHPWVASYQIGFGPPLIRASARLIERVRQARSAIEKLDAYLELCILNEEERRRLAGIHRRLVVRRQGPVESEALDDASAEVLDLSVRVMHPASAPPNVALAMREAGILAETQPLPADAPPEALSGRFFVRLTDPRNERLLHIESVARAAEDRENALAIELRIGAAARGLFEGWLGTFEREGAFRVIAIGDPAPHARVRTDGQSR